MSSNNEQLIAVIGSQDLSGWCTLLMYADCTHLMHTGSNYAI